MHLLEQSRDRLLQSFLSHGTNATFLRVYTYVWPWVLLLHTYILLTTFLHPLTCTRTSVYPRRRDNASTLMLTETGGLFSLLVCCSGLYSVGIILVLSDYHWHWHWLKFIVYLFFHLITVARNNLLSYVELYTGAQGQLFPFSSDGTLPVMLFAL